MLTHFSNLWLTIALIAVLLSTSNVLAAKHCHQKCDKPKLPWYIFNPRSCGGPAVEKAAPLLSSASQCEVKRAGWAHKIFPWATPSDTCNYRGYYVGGGGGCCCNVGDCCNCNCGNGNRGTWGWDYQGTWIPRVVKTRLDATETPPRWRRTI